jgi:hypothetical protein
LAGDATNTDTVGHSISIFELADATTPLLILVLAIRFEFRIGRSQIGRSHSWPFKFNLAGDATTTDTIGRAILIFELAAEKATTTDTMGYSNFELAGDATTTDTIGHAISIFELAAEKATTDTMGHSNFELAGDATTTDTIGHAISIFELAGDERLLLSTQVMSACSPCSFEHSVILPTWASAYCLRFK